MKPLNLREWLELGQAINDKSIWRRPWFDNWDTKFNCIEIDEI